MGKSYSRSIVYTPLSPGDVDLPLLNNIVDAAKAYYVVYTLASSTVRAVAGTFRNFGQAYRACKLLTGSAPRCFFRALIGAPWLAANPSKMPH